MSFALDVVTKTTLLLLCVSVLSWTLSRASASLRHAIWAAGLLAVLVFPAASSFLPSVDLALLPASHDDGGGPAPAEVPLAIEAVPSAAGTTAAIPAAAETSWNWAHVILLMWAAGFGFVSLQSFVALRDLRRLKSESRFLTGDGWTVLLSRVRNELSVSTPVQLRSSGVSGPLAIGILDHAILMPAAAEEWSAERRRLVLAHELAHVKRNDGLGQILCQLVCSVYWFNPLVWYAVRSLRAERERACDDYVVRLGGCAADYADHLLQIARSMNSGFALTALSMAHPSQLKSRVMSILDSGMRRKRMSRTMSAALLLATAVFTMSLASLHVTRLSAAPLPAPIPAPRSPVLTQPVSTPPAVPQSSPGFVVNRTPLSYPPEAQQKRIEGTVAVELTFNARGSIIDSRVLSGPEELRQTALQTAVQGQYGINTARTLQVLVDFKLPAAGSAQLNGTVTDASRAPLPNVSVAITNTRTGVTSTALTNALGEYHFSNLAPGPYRARTELGGFEPQSFDNVTLGNAQQVRLNFALRPRLPFSPTNPAAEAGPGFITPITPPVDLPRTEQRRGSLEGLLIYGLSDPQLTEMRQRLQVFQGQEITSELVNQVRDSIRETGWGMKPVGFMVVPSAGGTGSDLRITFYGPPASGQPRVRVGGNVLAMNLVQQVKPVYPQDAKDARIQGVVVMEVEVGTDGKVTALRVITGHPLLIQAALDAVKQWVYNPVIVGGQPVEAVSTVTVNFAFQQ